MIEWQLDTLEKEITENFESNFEIYMRLQDK